jgi:hypothetical protein
MDFSVGHANFGSLHMTEKDRRLDREDNIGCILIIGRECEWRWGWVWNIYKIYSRPSKNPHLPTHTRTHILHPQTLESPFTH